MSYQNHMSNALPICYVSAGAHQHEFVLILGQLQETTLIVGRTGQAECVDTAHIVALSDLPRAEPLATPCGVAQLRAVYDYLTAGRTPEQTPVSALWPQLVARLGEQGLSLADLPMLIAEMAMPEDERNPDEDGEDDRADARSEAARKAWATRRARQSQAA